MADNTTITPGGGLTVATDDVAGVHFQKVKLVDGTADSAALIAGDATYGLDVDVTRMPPSVVVSATPTLDTAIYASGDSLHTTVLSFASAVRVSGGTGRVRKLVVVDKDLQSAAGELWLFSATVTPAAANAAHSISDADAALCIGVIPFGTWYASALNSVSVASPDLPIACAATTLFGILVTRGTPTHTAAGLLVSLQIAQD